MTISEGCSEKLEQYTNDIYRKTEKGWLLNYLKTM